MDNLFKEFFGVGVDDDDDIPPQEAADTSDEERERAREAKREARRAARKARKEDAAAAAKRSEFSDRYQAGSPSEGFTAEEAIEHLQELQQELSPAEFRKAMEQTLNNLPVDQRDDFIALMKQYKAEAAKEGPRAAAAQDPLGGLLGSLMGGGAARGGAPNLGDVLNDLKQGGLSAPPPAGGGQPTEQDFLQLINSPLGKAVLGGLVAYGMKQIQQDDDPRR